MITAELGPTAWGVFTTRAGGVSQGRYASLNLGGRVGDEAAAVTRNHQLLAQRVGGPVSFARQVHGKRVYRVPGGQHGTDGHATDGADSTDGTDSTDDTGDAVLTTERAHPVGVLVADCVPVLLAGPEGVVAVHAGRRGLLAGVVGAALAAMASDGRGATHAAIGPAICGRCYEVPEQMRTEAARSHPAIWARTSWGTPALDLPAAVAHELTEAGIGHIDRADTCTRTDDRFFSHRRDPVTGRFAGVVVRR